MVWDRKAAAWKDWECCQEQVTAYCDEDEDDDDDDDDDETDHLYVHTL